MTFKCSTFTNILFEVLLTYSSNEYNYLHVFDEYSDLEIIGNKLHEYIFNLNALDSKFFKHFM